MPQVFCDSVTVGQWLDFGSVMPEGRFGQVHSLGLESAEGYIEVRFPGRGIVVLSQGFDVDLCDSPDPSRPDPFPPEPADYWGDDYWAD